MCTLKDNKKTVKLPDSAPTIPSLSSPRNQIYVLWDFQGAFTATLLIVGIVRTVILYIVLQCTVLQCTVLYCIAVYCIVH